MARIYSQSRSEPNMTVIADGVTISQGVDILSRYAVGWTVTKKGRAAAQIAPMEVGFYFSDGKLACTMWVDPLPTPKGEPKFAPAVGEIPGLTA